ncbi:RNA-directed DNA polymerase, eukaryota, reverse transcriptase zinc-binding domain protein [Tanacetum coccineum]
MNSSTIGNPAQSITGTEAFLEESRFKAGGELRDDGFDGDLDSNAFSDGQSVDSRSCGDSVSEKDAQADLVKNMVSDLGNKSFKVGNVSEVNDFGLGIRDKLGPMPVPVDEDPILSSEEAWNVEGISRIASRIGNPIIMDRITNSMCEKAYGRASFARVLVEVEAAKGLVDSVQVCYKALDRDFSLENENVQFVPVNKGKESVNVGGAERGMGKKINKKDGTSSENRFVMLSEEIEIEENLEWDYLKAKIDEACEKGIYISMQEKKEWPGEVMNYYKLKLQELVKKSDVDDLKLKIENLERQIAHSHNVVTSESRVKAKSMVKSVMIEQGLSENQAFGKIISKVHCFQFMAQEEIANVMNNDPWDFNAVLRFNENSNGLNIQGAGIKDFRECIDSLELEDINMTGLFYTWIQKMRNPELGVLKKLDRIMGNAHFISKYANSFAVFMPYLTSDHSPAILTIPDLACLYEAALMRKNVKSQKRQIEWLRDGDFNSSYFHSVVKGRTSRNRIEMVLDDSGNAHYGDNVTNMFVSHFEKKLGTHGGGDVSFIEVRKEAIFSIEDNKASGPDGFSSKFFKAAWMVIGNDVCAAIKEFFTSGKLLGEFNTTLISLVPKSKTPARVIDYRPISCCNIVYKGISKVITNRLKTVLSELVDVNQSAFIPGRQISDNILLAQEFLKGYNWKYVTGCCAFKIDIMKAYDTVSWSFLEFCLKEFGFHPVMINWIMVCLKTASFSVCVNGESHGFFKAKRGLRQGDPISPYLFTLVMEVLNLMVKRQIKRDSRFKYHTGCSKLKITSLCFADDLLMLCHGDVVSASILRRGLDEFSLASGLYPSMSKSEAFFSNVCPDAKNEILMAMPFREGTLPIRYLGVPLASRRIKASDCRVLIDAVKNRINDWRNKSLSFAGRLQLISSILSSLQVYWCSLFILAKLICETIDKMVKNFLWAREGNTSGVVSIGWKENGIWSWPEEWEGRFSSVLDVSVPVINHNVDDKVYWVNKKGKEKGFSVAKERNSRIFQQMDRSEDSLFEVVVSTVRLRLRSLKSALINVMKIELASVYALMFCDAFLCFPFLGFFPLGFFPRKVFLRRQSFIVAVWMAMGCQGLKSFGLALSVFML